MSTQVDEMMFQCNFLEEVLMRFGHNQNNRLI